MPIDPGMVEALAATTGALYEDAEQRLLGIVARALAAGLESPAWAERKLAAVQPLRRAAQAVVADLADGVPDTVRTAIADAYGTGARAAVDELGLLGRRARALVDEHTPQAQAVDRLAAETVDIVTATHRGILRGVEDGYRQVIAEVSGTPLLGVDTRRQATQQAMSRFAGRGISSFTDRSGRRWQLTSYAEMAVRTSVARAATEAHAQTLTAAGVDLVIVSDSPRECPLCRPWEGKVLALSGPDGPHDVQAEHGTEDDRMVTVHVAGTLDEARRAGLQHPNCRHSTSAYLPGVTRPIHARSDPDGYEAGQRQRAIERNIRRWKREAAGSVDPAGKRAAQAKVRAWQGAMRQHLADHPDLRRLPAREQPGASNLPRPRPPVADVHAQAARVRAGDHDTIREMTDHDLAAAARSRTLDQRDLHRIDAEAERRDTADLLDRVRPNGRIADDLTGVSDEDLARSVAHLDDDGALRVAAELNRRDIAAGLPDTHRDLIGLSDHDLAARARNANPGELARVAEEADRRDRLATLYPGGGLAADLSELGDDLLAWGLRYADPGEAARIAAEVDRRYPPAPLPAASTAADPVDALLADRAALDEALQPAAPLDEWGVQGDSPEWGAWAEGEGAQALAEAAAAAEAAGAGGGAETVQRLTRAQARAMYAEYVWSQYLAAEDELRGVLLNARGRAAGIDPSALFSGPARTAYAYASDELTEWWAANGRLTQAEFVEASTGVRSAAAETARKAEADAQNRR